MKKESDLIWVSTSGPFKNYSSGALYFLNTFDFLFFLLQNKLIQIDLELLTCYIYVQWEAIHNNFIKKFMVFFLVLPVFSVNV